MAKLAITRMVARLGGWTAREIEDRLRRNHDTGKKLLEGSDGRSTYSEQDTEKLKIHLRECRRFAKAYTPCELEALLTLQTQQGTPLPWSIVRLLMGVTDKNQREKLEKRAAEENWSVMRTTMFIQAKIFREKRSVGGRPCAPPPDDVEELIQQVERYLGESKRRLALWVGALQKKKPSAKRVSQRLRSRIHVASESLKSVGATSNELARMLESIAENDSKTGKVPLVPAAESGSRKR